MYAVLQVIWFALWGLLWAIYFGLDGFDLGAGMMAGFAGNKDERNALIDSLSPVWDGNEVWVITAGGVTFAAFPAIYATMFSSLYIPLILILLGLVLRAVAIEFFHHMDYSPAWQNFWAKVLGIASLVVALLFGVAFGNLFEGLPITAEGWQGNVTLSLLNPFGILVGLLFVCAFLMNGSSWIAHKVPDQALREKFLKRATTLWYVVLVLAVLFLGLGYKVGLWTNYLNIKVLLIVPLAAVALLIWTYFNLRKANPFKALWTGSLTVLLAAVWGVGGMFPKMIFSKLDPSIVMDCFNSSSSQYTLTVMLVVVLIFLPFVLIYQGFALKTFGKHSDLENHY